MRIAFAGTPEFAATALRALHAAGHDIALVLTQPDRPAGRGLKLQASPVKAWALAHGLPVAQPRSLRLDGRTPEDAKQARDALQAAGIECLVVAAYGLILPRWTLDLPPLGCLNIHASLLPRWRGAAPIHRAIEAGDSTTGVTLMQMNEGLDTGDMVLSHRLEIRPDDTTGSLHDRLAALGGQMAAQALTGGTWTYTPQPLEGVTYARKIEKAEARLDWNCPAAVLERRMRAFDPFPGAHFMLNGQPVKAWRARVRPELRGVPGQVLQAHGKTFTVACADGALELLQLQSPGGRRMDAAAWLAAHGELTGTRLAAEAPATPA
ncbi:MAG: methionyl-tRNA formyltransferase [Burkholderiaceae bacterium]|jgi:methionyl-tRNA formyltransferase|nr:methionyl-tRNA formyltransferase [Aquabacterium sp.]NUP84232.1 methionyl-tRNA formyltransferase [Burkholderiaceae bacterium]